MGKSKVDSNYQSAVTQAGIQAGDGGFQVNVKGNTDLKGAVIASNDKAIADNKNSLTTGTLTTSDLQNSSSTSAEVSNTTLSSDMMTQGKYGVAKGLLTNGLGSTDASSSSTGYANAAISAGSVVITDNAKQLASTGKTAEQTVAGLNRDTANALRTVKRQDVQEIQKAVQADQAIKQESIKTVVTLTDEAYRVMFASKAKVYKLPPGCDNAKCAVEVSPEDLQKSQDQKVHVSNNGIFTSLDDAIRLANQNAPAVEDTSTGAKGKPTNQYLVYFPETNNTISELMVALYQKAMEPILGLSNATQTNVGIINTYGNDGLIIDGHSRGSMTTDNAMSDILNSYGVGAAKNLNLSFFGAAANVADADKTLSQLQDRQFDQQKRLPIQSVVHIDDFVGRIIGGNPATGGARPTNPDGTPRSQFSEWLNILDGEHTAHNCYGTGQVGCAPYWTPSLPTPMVKPAPTP